jgi:hypothetical protein
VGGVPAVPAATEGGQVLLDNGAHHLLARLDRADVREYVRPLRLFGIADPPWSPTSAGQALCAPLRVMRTFSLLGHAPGHAEARTGRWPASLAAR